MKNIEYYAGFLSSTAQREITDASMPQLAEFLETVADSLYGSIVLSGDYKPLEHMGHEDASARDKLALVRGLCDAIELKLMQEAK